MATPTAASPRGVRSGLCCFFFRFLAQKPVETFCDWFIYFIFFIRGGYELTRITPMGPIPSQRSLISAKEPASRNFDVTIGTATAG